MNIAIKKLNLIPYAVISAIIFTIALGDSVLPAFLIELLGYCAYGFFAFPFLIGGSNFLILKEMEFKRRVALSLFLGLISIFLGLIIIYFAFWLRLQIGLPM